MYKSWMNRLQFVASIVDGSTSEMKFSDFSIQGRQSREKPPSRIIILKTAQRIRLADWQCLAAPICVFSAVCHRYKGACHSILLCAHSQIGNSISRLLYNKIS